MIITMKGMSKGNMTDDERKLLDMYARKADNFSLQYSLMGKMMDTERLKKGIERIRLGDAYIYGGSYLGIFAYKMLNEFVNIKGIIDKRGVLFIPISDIPVITIDGLRKNYAGEEIVITPLAYANEIVKELSTFIEKKKMVFINEII